jgi:hypothetical protein
LQENGKPIRGSAVTEEKDIASDEIQKRFKHETDFWLKNMYRKKKPAPTAAPGGADAKAQGK